MGMASFILTVIIILGFLLKVYKTPSWRTDFVEFWEDMDSPVGAAIFIVFMLWAIVLLTFIIPLFMFSLFILVFLGFYIGYKIHKKHEEDEESGADKRL